MKVSSAASMHGREFSVELDEADVPSAANLDGIVAKHRALMQVADALIVTYMLDAELITAEYAADRKAEIAQRGLQAS